MQGLYSKPLRVYLIMGALALWGLLSGSQLPISLFPKSDQSTIVVHVNYGSLSSEQFVETHGKSFENLLQGIRTAAGAKVENVTAQYRDRNVNYLVKFGWGAEPEDSKKAVETLSTSYFSSSEGPIRRSVGVNSYRENQGFFAISFFSPLRSLDDVYNTLQPLVIPLSSKVPDANGVNLYNPSNKEITLKLSPEKMALHHLTTAQIESSVRTALISMTGGTVRIGEKELQLTIPKGAYSLETLNYIRVSALSKTPVLLKDVAQISIVVGKDREQKFKTSGVDSLILFANPKEGGNIKKMSDDILAEIKKLETQWPKDIQYKILVNPSDFIDESIKGVVHEVALAAFLAVIVLFFFIGSFKNVATAAIEIPISLVMAFILMKLTGMNLNLISLGGLALSAGMNVDASVVVLENIFRHFEGKSKSLNASERLSIILKAVEEVRLPIIASTLASLVVFTPLIFTQGLTNALLGDLAKAVIFSHGISAIVALILVPTIRLQLMKSGGIAHSNSPIEGKLKKLENFYARSLTAFLRSYRSQVMVILGVVLLLPALIFGVVPHLKKEVIGRPETDWLIVGINSPTLNSAKQMESEVINLESDLFKNYGSQIEYTFTQIHGSRSGNVMMRLQSRKQVEDLLAKVEERYKNTPTLFYWVEKWNPSELTIPDPPNFKLEIIGGSAERRLQVSEDILAKFTDLGIYDKVRVNPSSQRVQYISIIPLTHFTSSSEIISRDELSHYLRTATEGSYVESMTEGFKTLPVYLRFPEERTKSLEEIQALPIGFEGRLVPLAALAQFQLKPRPPEVYRENMTSMVQVIGRLNKSNLQDAKSHNKNALEVIEAQRINMQSQKISAQDQPTLNLTVPDIELQQALDQLKTAVLISILLVFLVMVIQLGDVVQASLVMVSVPLGLIGVIISLFVFGSSISLNSGLGTLLLNGIAVANSIILVDFIQKLFEQGKSPLEATVQASTTRLRPILMTSLTTVLGMLPIALGMGEGGQILQPLGIAVCGGLWVSALLTLYIVPALQYQYLCWKKKSQDLALSTDKVVKMDFKSFPTEIQP